MTELVQVVHDTYPDNNIVLSEVTPRNDERDGEVKICNDPLIEFSKTKEYIFVAKQKNLRNPEYTFFYDAKQVKMNKIARYASNMKIALRKAHSMVEFRKQQN